jgi:capsid protein
MSYAGPYLLMSGYDGANDSPRRGMLYWPTTDTRLEASPLSRWEMRRRAHWLYANMGIARRLVNGSARLIGVQTPQPDTSSEEWNTLMFENFMERMSSPLLFDRAGKFDFFEGQLQMERVARKDGFILPVLTESEAGGAQVCFYESHQLVNPLKPAKGEKWLDGVLTDSKHRHVEYSLRDALAAEQIRRIDAADALYYGRFESWGEVHPMSVLAPAVNHLVDIVETRADVKHAIKRSSQFGVVKETATGQITGLGQGGVGGPVVSTQITKPDGTTQDINWEVVTGSAMTPNLKPGETLKVIHDERPGPNQRDFERDLIADCAGALDLPTDALFFVAGVTGPGIRYNMADIRRWVLVQNIRRARWNQRFYATYVAKEMKAGRVPACPDAKFWKATWLNMADPTIDLGKEGNLAVVQLDAGLTTWADEWGEQGAWWKTKIKQRCREVAYAKREVVQAAKEFGLETPEPTLDYREVFPPRAGAVAPEAPGKGDAETRRGGEGEKKKGEEEEE